MVLPFSHSVNSVATLNKLKQKSVIVAEGSVKIANSAIPEHQPGSCEANKQLGDIFFHVLNLLTQSPPP
jgi:hypothetical protein